VYGSLRLGSILIIVLDDMEKRKGRYRWALKMDIGSRVKLDSQAMAYP